MTILAKSKADFTNFFSSITNETTRYDFMNKKPYLTWEKKWHSRIQNIPRAKETMRQANPSIIPRNHNIDCLLYTSPSPRDRTRSRMPSSA